MFPQPADFRDESDALHALVRPLDAAALERPTAFKGWTIADVIRHLHLWNGAAELSLREPAAFAALAAEIRAHLDTGASLGAFERLRLGAIPGPDLVAEWRETYIAVAERFAGADPSARVQWFGPPMSVRSSITARLMETWAHGQEIYDVLGMVRRNADRIRNIVVLGVNTFEWTFKVRGETPPAPRPHLVLTAPSGAIWTWNEPSATERIEGAAEEFCQVVTQVRNVADTCLAVRGPVATDWMSKAQCFAGPPETPPAPGTRRTAPRA
jgi:uncharacterized protein (TIGR03084 family)